MKRALLIVLAVAGLMLAAGAGVYVERTRVGTSVPVPSPAAGARRWVWPPRASPQRAHRRRRLVET
jgi:hypothetical protein